ncbi:MAG: TonB-dependent receptor [Opitutaceae bacterium]|nr:TonB-dependent receptor [Opitutaceae bacterium]
MDQTPSQSGHELLTTNRKALVINLDETRYGTFAEIGAGQEVARHFFQAGGAAGTVAKTMSAYDMAFSDAIYGKSQRYVSRHRLETMLRHEYELLPERLSGSRGDTTRFFVFANTIAAKSYRGNNECHGWLGVRFQTEPHRPPCDIIAHVRLWDRDNITQQQAVGVFGVNLIYGAFYLAHDPAALVRSLIDNLSTSRIEVDLIEFAGPDFAAADNRLLTLQLVEEGLTNAVFFGPGGSPQIPAEAFYKKAVLVQRGSFHPITHVHLDMMRCAADRFAQEPAVADKPVVQLLEMSMSKLRAAGGRIDHRDFLERVDTLSAVGMNVLVSNDLPYFRLTSYFRRYTPEMVGFTMGARALGHLFDESAYAELDGGILEAFGRLFKSNVRLYVYPRLKNPQDPAGPLVDASNIPLPEKLRDLHAHVLHNGLVQTLTGFDRALLPVFARDVFDAICRGDPGWELLVPAAAATVIKERRLFI